MAAANLCRLAVQYLLYMGGQNDKLDTKISGLRVWLILVVTWSYVTSMHI